MRIGIFGGSFDPVHLGHLLLAERALVQLSLERVIFVPAAIPPHKQHLQLTGKQQRLEMLHLAIGGNDRFVVDTFELDREEVSYTVDTLLEFRQSMENDDLYLLMGADSLFEFATWKEPQRICQLAIPVVVARPGSPAPDLSVLRGYVDDRRYREIEEAAFESLQVEISSSSIREAASGGQRFRYQTPPAVERYLLDKKLYAKTENG